MRLAIAGLGAAADRGHLPAIERLAAQGAVTLVAAADPDTRTWVSVRSRFPGAALFESAEDMLAAVACDAFVVSAGPSTHADLIALGLRRGRHVICEKPLVVTRADYDRVARAHAQRPELAIVAVHQYRYSPTWAWIARTARVAARLGVPFLITIDVQRTGTDPLALSSWRSDVDNSGGMLADHGVHFLALGWTVTENLDVLAGARACNEAGECSDASVRLGSGALRIKVGNAQAIRRTRVTLNVATVALTWCDDDLRVIVGRRLILRRSTDALADRTYVDALYDRLYDDIWRHLKRPAWRAHRTTEALVVGRALLALLDIAPEASPPLDDAIAEDGLSRRPRARR